jgi:NAD-dependent dihydropyrimidine dehydrogenase PreA subunit
MCEFCIRHGDGEKWYLNAANYAETLLADLQREKYIADFLPTIMAKGGRWLKIIDRGRRFVPSLTDRILQRKAEEMKKIHYGQVIPLEDVRAIMEIVGQVGRLPCVCRQTLYNIEDPVCYLITASPDLLGFQEIIGRRQETLPFVGSLERVSTAHALAEMERLEDRGMIHTVWTFITPFIGALCNCDRSGCLGMQYTGRGLRLFFPGEEAIRVEHEACSACGRCVEICPFNAFAQGGDGMLHVDRARCHGCGICRRVCPTAALSLMPR